MLTWIRKFLRKLNEETFAIKYKSKEGTVLLTFRQSLRYWETRPPRKKTTDEENKT